MIFRYFSRLVIITLSLSIIFSAVFAFAANIVVPVTRHSDQRTTITPNTLKPVACSAITVTAIVYCPAVGGICNGTNANELIIGSPSVDIIQGKGGSDCIVGGNGNDDITGSQASDVCIGGPGTDTFTKCEGFIQ
jgi:Ca2+-binding RTX toxin-like protein